MKDNIIINDDTIFEVPLIVPMASKYFEKIDNKNVDKYYRAVDLRICLEKICDEFIYKFIEENDKIGWAKNNLYNKLFICEEYLDKKCIDALMNAKNIGNTGAHEGEEGDYTEQQFIEAKKAIFDFSLEVLAFYLRKYGYANLENGGSWIPYFFSTLPPLYRVKVLRKYFEFNKEGIVIEKLAMAYTKAGKHEEMIAFLDECLTKKYINNIQHESLLDEMKQIEGSLSKLPIAKTMQDAKKNFNYACTQIAPCCDLHNEPFVLLMSLIFYGDKDNNGVK